MGGEWTGAVAGGGVPPSPKGRVALGLPASLLYFKWVAMARPMASDSARRFASGAIDPGLPVAVENCLLHCSGRDGGLAVFAIERSKLNAALRDFEKSPGRGCDCVVPLPLAAWDYAAEEVAATGAAPAAPLLHLDAAPGRWTLCAGRTASCRDGAAPLEAVMSVADGDQAAAVRSARLLSGRLGGSPLLVVTGRGASDADVAAMASAVGAVSAIDLRGETPDDGALLARYVRRRYFSHDLPIMEAEGPAARRRRAVSSLLPVAMLAAGAAALAISSLAYCSAAGLALRETDAAIDRAATMLAGAPMRLHGPAAAEAARRAFAERTESCVMRSLAESPREVLRSVLTFAGTRGIAVSGIEGDGKSVTVFLRPEDDGDMAALEAELGRGSARAVALERQADGAWRLDIGLEDAQ